MKWFLTWDLHDGILDGLILRDVSSVAVVLALRFMHGVTKLDKEGKDKEVRAPSNKKGYDEDLVKKVVKNHTDIYLKASMQPDPLQWYLKHEEIQWLLGIYLQHQ